MKRIIAYAVAMAAGSFGAFMVGLALNDRGRYGWGLFATAAIALLWGGLVSWAMAPRAGGKR